MGFEVGSGTSRRSCPLWVCVSAVAILVLASGCAAGSNPMVGTPAADGETAGFFLGLWHGFIMPFAFVASLFLDDVSIYEVHNSGGWYNLGYLIGLAGILGGGGSAAAYDSGDGEDEDSR